MKYPNIALKLKTFYLRIKSFTHWCMFKIRCNQLDHISSSIQFEFDLKGKILLKTI